MLSAACAEVIMYLLNTNLGKEINTFIFSQEKYVEPVAMSTNHSIPRFLQSFCIAVSPVEIRLYNRFQHLSWT